MPNYNNCLRPTFTENIVKDLKKGESLNIYGAKGQGRKRLLEDLQNCQLDDMQMLLINIRTHIHGYQGFLAALAKEIGYVKEAVPKLANLLDEIERSNKAGELQTIILLYNFDSLFDNDRLHKDYGTSFFDNLNSIKNRENMVLVCVTEKRYNSYMIYTKEIVERGSWLDLKAKKLSELDMEQIDKEIERHFPALRTNELRQFGKLVAAHRLPYPLLEYIAERIENGDDAKLSAVEKRFKKWQKQFDKENPVVSAPAVDGVAQRLSGWLKILRIDGIFNESKAILQIILNDYILYFIKRSFDLLESIFKRK